MENLPWWAHGSGWVFFLTKATLPEKLRHCMQNLASCGGDMKMKNKTIIRATHLIESNFKVQCIIDVSQA
jgi:hypothetical protein